MAQLIVRNLDSRIVRQLKLRAAGNGRSAEAEHRAILEQVLLPRPRREPGGWQGRVWMADDFTAPLPAEVLADFEGSGDGD